MLWWPLISPASTTVLLSGTQTGRAQIICKIWWKTRNAQSALGCQASIREGQVGCTPPTQEPWLYLELGDIWAMLRKRGWVSRESREAEPRHNCDLVTPNKKPSLAPDCQVDKIQTPQGGMQRPSHPDPRMTSPSSSPGLPAPSNPPSHPSLDDETC